MERLRPSAGEPIWKLAVLWLIVMLIVSCPAFGGAVINAQMGVALKMDRTVLGAGFGLCSMAAGTSAPLVAFGFRYFGIRNVMLAGVTLATIAAALMSTVVSTGWAFILSYGLLMGIAIGSAGLLPAQTVVARWFPTRRAFAVAVVMSAGEFAGIVMPPAFAWLIDATGNWRSGWWVTLASVVVGGLLILWIIPGNLAADQHDLDTAIPPMEHKAGGPGVYKTPTPWLTRQVIRTRSFLLIALFGVTTCVDWVFLLAHGVEHLQDLGYGSTVSASAISIIVAASFFGNAAAGMLGDRIAPHLLGIGALLLIALGVLLALAPAGLAGMLLFTIIFGFGYGAGQVCWITMLSNYFGPKVFPSLFGIMLAISSISAEIGATTAGAVFDHLHSYNPVFLFLSAMTGVIALLQSLASPQSVERARVANMLGVRDGISMG